MSDVRRTILRAIGVSAAVLAVIGTILLLSGSTPVGACLGITQLGWFAPVLSIIVIGGVAGLLLGSHRADSGGRTNFEPSPCPACGRDVLGDWRMCPYCGGILSARVRSQDANH